MAHSITQPAPYLASIRDYEQKALLIGGTLLFGSALALGLLDISGGVVAPAIVVVENNSRKIQHLDGGIVSEVRVKNGDIVAAGDVLLKLDVTDAQANFEIAEAQLDEIKARKERLVCEAQGCNEVKAPAPGLSISAAARADAIWGGQARLFEARRELRINKKRQIAERIGQIESNSAALAAQRTAQGRQLDLSKKELAALAPLEKRELIPLSRSLNVQREHERLNGELLRLDAELQRAGAQLAEARLQLAEVDQSNLSEVLGELREVGAKEAELQEKVIALKSRRDRTTVVAPSAGVVHNLTATTITGVVKAGETVAEIVPQNEDLVLEARVETSTVDRLEVDQSASVRFSGFDQRKTPVLEGRVSLVAPDANQDQRNGQAFYIVRAKLLPGEMERLGGQTLRPGMPSELHFNTGERSILSYLMKPFSDQMARAFRER